MHKVVFICGDGIGPEVANAAREVIEATGVAIQWVECLAGETAIEKFGVPLPDITVEAIRRYKVALKGPITTPVGERSYRSVNVALRQLLGLYACIRPCKSYPGVRSKYENIDLVVIRENSEDLYSGIEFETQTPNCLKLIEQIELLSGKCISKDSGISIKPISRHASQRIVKFAFEYAIKYKRRKVTAVHKANIMKFTDGVFLSAANEVSKSYPEIEFEVCLVDNMCMQLVQKPQDYDVLVMPNLYGDIISDLCAGLIGGLGVAPSANIGEDCAIFEPVHGSAPKYAGKNRVNPTAAILSGALLLKYLGEQRAANIIEQAVAETIKEAKFVTYDLKPYRDDPTAVGTAEMTAAIIQKVKAVM